MGFLLRFCAFSIILTGITIGSASFASAQIVALGSSTVDDQRVSSNEMWPAVLEGMLRAKGSQTHVKNAGVWGDTTEGTLSRVSSAVPDGTKTVILMINGYNDAHKLSQAPLVLPKMLRPSRANSRHAASR